MCRVTYQNCLDKEKVLKRIEGKYFAKWVFQLQKSVLSRFCVVIVEGCKNYRFDTTLKNHNVCACLTFKSFRVYLKMIIKLGVFRRRQMSILEALEKLKHYFITFLVTSSTVTHMNVLRKLFKCWHTYPIVYDCLVKTDSGSHNDKMHEKT